MTCTLRIFANCATLAGHCELGDHVFLSGHVAVHQFTRIGTGAMIVNAAVLGLLLGVTFMGAGWWKTPTCGRWRTG